VEQSEIQKHFNSGNYQQALKELDKIESSHWTDTTKLRCLRAMGSNKALPFAEQLKSDIESSSERYSMNTSERNNQLRYLALVFAEQGKPDAACEIMSDLCSQSPDVAALHREYAYALSSSGKLDMAESELNRALVLQPKNASSHAQLGRIYCRTGRTDAGYNSYARAATLEPNNPTYTQRLLYWSNYSERTSQQSNYHLSQLWANKAFPDNKIGSNTWRTANPDRQLKLGIVSSDLCAHAVSFFITPLLEELDRTDFEVTAYSDTHQIDHVTKSIKSLCDVWRDSSNLSDTQLAAQVSADQIDILIDLNGHTGGNRLGVFAKHVAPLQISWLGYPSTTGLKSIGYRITDRIADPVGVNDDFFSEKLLRLPNGFLCFKPLESAPKVNLDNRASHIRFGSFNNLAKVSKLTLDCWAAALLAVPNSTLYLKRQQLINKNAIDYFLKQLADRGDTTPYNGTTTTLEALWMGVPVLSLSGQTHASRVTASILHRLNLSSLAAKSVYEFAQRAKELAERDDTLKELKHNLRKRMRDSSLMNQGQFAYEFGNTLRSQWRDWCHERNIEEGIESAKPVIGAAK